MGLIALPLVPPALVALGEAVVFVGSAALAAWGINETANIISNEMAKAEEEAKSQTKAETKTITCATCKENPCAHLACGVPGSKYRGGAHGCVGLPENKSSGGGAIHSHHVPAKAYSPLPEPVGPAIQIDRADHYATSSYGGNVHGPRYAAQRTALANGQTMQALLMDIAEVRALAMAQGDPTKYDSAIAQTLAYANCLKANGIIQ